MRDRARMAVLLVAVAAIAAAARGDQRAAIPRAVESYARVLEAITGGALRQPTLESLLGVGRLAAVMLAGEKGVLEDLGDADYQTVVQQMTGFRVSRDPIVYVEPDPDFFLNLSKTHGTAHDLAFFQRYKQTIPDGVWDVYIQQTTDESGCVRFGSLTLVEAYTRWTAFRQQFPKHYITEVAQFIGDIEDTLLEETCACEGPESVLEELSAFVKAFPDATVTLRVRERLAQVQQGTSDFQFKCVGG